MNKEEFSVKYMRTYAIIEKQFIESLDYVYPTKANYKTYSDKYQHLYLLICSEIESIIKVSVYKLQGREYKIKNMIERLKNDDWYKRLFNDVAFLDEIDEHTKPWELIDKTIKGKGKWQQPKWWDGYNAIKHNKYGDDALVKANMVEIYKILAAYYMLLLRFYADVTNQKEAVCLDILKYSSTIITPRTIKFCDHLLIEIGVDWNDDMAKSYV